MQRKTDTPIPVQTRLAGLSLFELLVTLLIAGLLTGLGIAGFRQLILDARLTSQVNAFVGAVHLARQTASQVLVPVSLCAGHGRCDPDGDWNLGWTAFVNRDGDEPPVVDADETILAMHSPWQDGRIHANRHAFSFRPFSLRDTNGTVGFCGPRGDAAARAVVISPTGRPRLASRPEVHRRVICAR